MWKVCIVVFQMIQKFDDEVNFLQNPRKRMDLYWWDQKIDIASKNRGVHSAIKLGRVSVYESRESKSKNW